MRTVFVVPAALLALAAPATASAATLTSARACYVEGDAVHATGAGYTPGANYFLQGLSVYTPPAAVNPDGTFTTTFRAPLNPNENTGILKRKVDGWEEVEGASNVIRASLTLKIVSVMVTAGSSSGNPAGHTKWSFSGFAPHKKIYFHTQHNGHVYTQKAGRAKGPCGQLKKVRLGKLPAVPRSAMTDGKYRIRVDNHKKFLKHAKGRTYVFGRQIF